MMRLIDADELKKKLYKDTTGWSHGEHPMVIEADDIDDAPTVDAEPVKHAHWIHHHDVEHYGKSDGAYWRCSSCGRILKDSNWFSYCPMCGARMDGKIEARRK